MMLDNNVNPVSHFEYVFYFLFRTYVPMADGSRWEEPVLGLEKMQRKVSLHGVRFEEDKRLFRRDAKPGESLDNWAKVLTQNWQSIVQVYTQAFGGDKKQAQAYCQQALFGVALLILDDGDNLEHHAINVEVKKNSLFETKAKLLPQIRFVQSLSEQALFRISLEGFNKIAYFHSFEPTTMAGKPFLKPLQLRLNDAPHLAPLQNDELVANPVFSVYGFSYGGDVKDWKDGITRLLVRRGPFNRSPLLSTLFTRLIMAQWQFGRINEAANNLRAHLQSKNNDYKHYAEHYGNDLCLPTHVLENQLQEMHNLKTEATLVLSQLQSALRILEMNADHLAKRLEQIRQETEQVNWKMEFSISGVKPVQWPPFQTEIPLLSIFELHIKKLQEHGFSLEQHINYLLSLQDKWHFYLETRRNRIGEQLNILIVALIFLLTGITGVVMLDVDNLSKLPIATQLIYFICLVMLLIPVILILGYLLTQLVRKFYCLIKQIYAFFKRI
jgi:uncharacterized DUF497 family protein